VKIRGEFMTPSLEHALAAVQQLSETEQNVIASLIMAEIEDERLWDEKFSQTQESLGRWAEKVRADIRAGKIRHQGIDEL
jgi:hypothetical protein